jgi:acetyl-CoA acetyltransferase
MRLEDEGVISGIGMSQIGRRLGRTGMDLTLEACSAAIADAGLTRDDIDGVSTFPGAMGHYKGFSGAGAPEIQAALGLKVNWYTGGMELPAQVSSVINALMAVATGLCRHVLVFRSVWEATAQGTGGRPPIIGTGLGRLHDSRQWSLPFGGVSSAVQIAPHAMRYMHDYGMTREQLAWIALNSRANAQLNENATYRTPLTLDDYLTARTIATPFCLYDCDAPCDGAVAVIVSAAETAKDLAGPAIAIEAVGSAANHPFSWDNNTALGEMMATDAADMLWNRTDLQPDDIDVAGLYDGYSWLTVAWLEALRICGRGEAGAFIDGGTRIARDGRLPLNTHGGQLSGGRLHGFGFLHEVCTQLRGEAGVRQVPDNPSVGVVANGGGPMASCLLLSRR